MSVFVKLWSWLTAPHPSLKQRGQRRQARLLAALLIFLIPVAFLFAIWPRTFPNWAPDFRTADFLMSLSATGVLIVAYGLNRSGHFKLATWLLILAGTALIFTFSAPYDSISKVDFLVFLVFFVLIASVMLSLRAVFVYVALNGVLMLFLPLLFPHLSLNSMVVGPFSFLMITSVVILLIAQYRNQLEIDRRAELADREARYRALLETTFEGIVVVEEGRITDSNPGFARMFDLASEEIRGRRVGAFFADASGLLDRRTEVGHPLDLTGTRESGEFPLEVVARPLDGPESPVHIIGMRDVSERRRMEAQLKEYADHLEALVAEKVEELNQERAKTIHAAKLASLGEMATGVAHELNQPLTSILFEADYLKMIARKAEKAGGGSFSPVMEELQQTGENVALDVERCRRIIDHLRAFGRMTGGYSTSVDVNSVIEDSFVLIGERLRQRGITVELDLTPDLPLVMADPNRLEQVFLNLITNAEYALLVMDRRIADGEVEREAYRKRLQVTTFLEGDWVVVTVRDTGSGIPVVDHDRIFEPFFTTRPVGEGVGLGLSISYGIVTQLGGRISFHSEENQGTTFTIRLPIPPVAQDGRPAQST